MMKENKMLEIVKWLGTICVIFAASARAFEYHDVDVVLSILGALIWAYASVKMKDNPLIVVNGFIAAILLYGAFS